MSPARGFDPRVDAAPPLEPVLELAARLERAGIVFALGGSGLLAACGLAHRVGDWDLTTDAPLERARAALEGLAFEPFGSSGVHADHKFVLPEFATELIVGFAMHGRDGVVRLPTIVTASWHGLPLGSPEVWAAAYALLGRTAKSEALLGWLRARGADPVARARLLGQPLPQDLARALSALPRRPAPLTDRSP
ncbi:MAG: hypothetical protein HZC42_09505 [Candidatus Eisenbacteria bacterium]|nr:hypothetical protein [Candidatus Eisenbacteria bacterium]